MKNDTETIIKALRVLALQFGDGVANAAIAEAADRLQEQQERIKRLERALEIIATADYRGNRSCESQLAYNALNFNP